MVITEIIKQLKLNQEIVKRLRNENKEQRKFLNKISESLIHKEQLLHVFQKYTRKVIRDYKIDQLKLENDLAKICFSYPCIAHSVKNFVKSNQQKELVVAGDNPEKDKFKKN